MPGYELPATITHDPSFGEQEAAHRGSVGNRFPDQLSDIDDQIWPGLCWIAGCADLANTDADGIIQPTIGLAVGEPVIEKGLNRALSGAAKVVKRAVEATTGEITQ